MFNIFSRTSTENNNKIKVDNLIRKNKHLEIKKDLSQKIVMEAIPDNNLLLAERFLQALSDSGINKELFDVKAMLLLIAINGTAEMLKLFLQWPIIEKHLESYAFSRKMLAEACFNSVDGIGIVENLLDFQYIQNVLENDTSAYHLRCAMQADSINIVKLLLNQDNVIKNINKFPNSILTDASKCGNIEILNLLISQKLLNSHIKNKLVTYIKDLSHKLVIKAISDNNFPLAERSLQALWNSGINKELFDVKDKLVAYITELYQKLVIKAISDNNFPLAERSLQALWDSGINKELFDVKEMLLLIASNGTTKMLKLFLQWPIFEKNFEDDKFSKEMLKEACFNSVDGVGIVGNLLDFPYIQKVLENDIHCYHLRCAMQENSIVLVRLLLNQDSVLKNINTFPDWILSDASKCENIEILNLLISQKLLNSHIKNKLVTYIKDLSQKLVIKAISDNNFPLAERSLQVLWDSGINKELFDVKDKLVTYITDLSQKIVIKAISDNNLPLAERSLQALWNSGINKDLFDVKAMLLLIASSGTVEMLKLFLQWPIFEKNFEDDKFSQEMLTEACFNSVDGVGIVENLLALQYIQKVLKNDIHAYHLRCAIQVDSIDLVKLLLNQDSVLKNINTFPTWILSDASKCENIEILNLLLSKTVLNSYIEENLVTYIGEALACGKLNAAQFLIAYSPFNEEKLIDKLYDNPQSLKNFLKLEYGLNYVKSKSKTILLDIVKLRKRCASKYSFPLSDEVIKILLSMPEIKNEHQSLKEAHNLLLECYYHPTEVLDILKEIINVEMDDKQNPIKRSYFNH